MESTRRVEAVYDSFMHCTAKQLSLIHISIALPSVQDAVIDAFRMLQWYAIYHTLACVVPAMFIAGAIATFLSKEAILKHLGPKAHPVESYGCLLYTSRCV